jgi:hypothetical protein
MYSNNKTPEINLYFASHVVTITHNFISCFVWVLKLTSFPKRINVGLLDDVVMGKTYGSQNAKDTRDWR